VNMHGILTGSDPAGMYSTAGGDTTCSNWTCSGEGSAIVGHHDRVGLRETRHMMSWNSSHGTRGCSQGAFRALEARGSSTASPPTDEGPKGCWGRHGPPASHYIEVATGVGPTQVIDSE